MPYRLLFFLLLAIVADSVFGMTQNKDLTGSRNDSLPEQYIYVLGIAQDAGYPQTGCKKSCCQRYWKGNQKMKSPVCLAIVDAETEEVWMIEASPDIKSQLQQLQAHLPFTMENPKGILLTHAHIGHYVGLTQIGREVMGLHKLPVFAMPRMSEFLRHNGPWSQLVTLENIALQGLRADSIVYLNDNLHITPFLVPHRDEYSETVGFRISGPDKEVVFIPDIDKWEKWDLSIIDLIAGTDYAFIDGTFYDGDELPNRNMAEIPHPFITESIAYFSKLNNQEKEKIHFIHFNHTNPLIWDEQSRTFVRELGFNVAEENKVYPLSLK